MSSLDHGLCNQLAEGGIYTSSIMIWGEDLTDCDLGARYYHQEVMRHSPETLYQIACQHDDGFQELLHLPRCVRESDDDLSQTILLHGIHDFTKADQLALLQLLRYRESSGFDNVQFILTVTKAITNILPELRGYFIGNCYYCRPLVQRRQDVLTLSEFILKWYFRREGIEDIELSLCAKAWLKEHHWPCSSHELIQRIANVAKTIDFRSGETRLRIDKDMFIDTFDKYGSSPFNHALQDVEKPIEATA